ncbi:MAG: hypothetical protein NTX25_23485 [Proteobacteria bacterium]|nr:hypothetical protein [Pseudomonadota bacterium]
MWTYKDLNQLSVNFRMRLLERKSNEWQFTPWFWLASWTHHNLGYFTLCSELKRKKDWTLFGAVFLMGVVRLFFGRTPTLHLPKSSDRDKIRVVLWTWLLEGDLRYIKSNRDRYFGDLSHFSDGVLLRVHTLVGKFSEEEITEALTRGCAIIAARRDLFRPLRAISFIVSKIWNDPSIALEIWKYLNPRYLDSNLVAKQLISHSSTLKNFQYFLLPYENQPEQKKVLNELKKQNRAKLIGYIHSALPNFPAEYLYLNDDIDFLLVHGSAYHDFFVDQLGWKITSKIVTIPSLRYQKKPENEYRNKIFLPYFIPNINSLLEDLKIVIDQLDFWDSTVQIHPANIQGHQTLKAKLEVHMQEIKGSNKKSDVRRDLSIVVGISSVLFECLEAGVETIQVSLEGGDDFFDSNIWKNLDTLDITKSCRSYRIRKKGSYINYASEEYGLSVCLLDSISTSN